MLVQPIYICDTDVSGQFEETLYEFLHLHVDGKLILLSKLTIEAILSQGCLNPKQSA